MTLLFGNLSQHGEVKMRSARLMDERRTSFKDKPLDEILTLHRANVGIDYDNIISVTIKRGLTQNSLRIVVQGPPEKKIDFWLEEGQVTQVNALLKKVLPNKIR
jgi:hypothetical protein